MELAGGTSAGDALRASFGAKLKLGVKLGTVSHSITHHKLTLEVHAAAWRGAAGRPLRWIPERGQDRYLVSSLFRKALEC